MFYGIQADVNGHIENDLYESYLEYYRKYDSYVIGYQGNYVPSYSEYRRGVAMVWDLANPKEKPLWYKVLVFILVQVLRIK